MIAESPTVAAATCTSMPRWTPATETRPARRPCSALWDTMWSTAGPGISRIAIAAPANRTRACESGTATIVAPVRRYYVTTFGCQMNAHDSERIKGMLEELGLGESSSPEEADVLVFNPCTIDRKSTRLN